MGPPKSKTGILNVVMIGIGALALIYYASFGLRLKLRDETDLFSMGQVEMNRGNCVNAIEIFRTFLAKDPHHLPTLQFKRDCEVKLSRWNEAIATSETIIAHDVSRDNKQILADLYTKVGRIDDAAKLVEEPKPKPSASPSLRI